MWRDAGAEVERFRVRIPRAAADGAGRQGTRAASRCTPATPSATPRSAATRSRSRRPTARPSSTTSTTSGATARSHDLNQFHKLAYMAPAMHNTGAVICEPVDIAIPKRHLHITYSAIKHSDKPFMGPVTAPERAEDALRMARILFGEDVRRPAHGDHRAGQLQLAAGLGRDHAGRAQGLRARQPVGDRLALRAGRRQHAGLGGRLGRAAQRRGARRDRVRPALPAGQPDDLRPLPRRGVDEARARRWRARPRSRS